MASELRPVEVWDRISRINWFHRIDFGKGLISPGVDDSPRKLKQLRFPDDLSGKSFLDIGAWDGYFSFEAEKRGAAHVLATDSFIWDGKYPVYSKAGFETARELLNSKVEDLRIDPFDVSPETVGVFDVVLLSGVIYHVKNPWLLLERAANVTRELLIIETVTDLNWMRRPGIAIFARGKLVGDPTNWCAPNIEALRVMLQDVGFSQTDVVWKRGMTFNIASAARRFVKHHTSPFKSIQQGRCAMHARR